MGAVRAVLCRLLRRMQILTRLRTSPICVSGESTTQLYNGSHVNLGRVNHRHVNAGHVNEPSELGR